MATPALETKLATSKTSDLPHTTGMCSYEPPQSLWEQVENKLQSDERLSHLMSAVPSTAHRLLSETTIENEFSEQVEATVGEKSTKKVLPQSFLPSDCLCVGLCFNPCPSSS